MSNPVQHAKGWVDSSQEKIRTILSDTETSLPKDVRKSLLEVYDDLHRAEVCLRMKENGA
jgi:hypothetical protein